ncbi:MAG TPA: hypothetical protein VIV12_26665 [Streptosporangiaceae bacterium]
MSRPLALPPNFGGSPRLRRQACFTRFIPRPASLPGSQPGRSAVTLSIPVREAAKPRRVEITSQDAKQLSTA